MKMIEFYCNEKEGSLEFIGLSSQLVGAPDDMYLAVDYRQTKEGYNCTAYIGSITAELLSEIDVFNMGSFSFKNLKLEIESYVITHLQEWKDVINSEYYEITKTVSTCTKEDSINVYRIVRAGDEKTFTAVIFPNKVEIFSGLANMPYATLNGIFSPLAVVAYLDNELQLR